MVHGSPESAGASAPEIKKDPTEEVDRLRGFLGEKNAQIEAKVDEISKADPSDIDGLRSDLIVLETQRNEYLRQISEQAKLAKQDVKEEQRKAKRNINVYQRQMKPIDRLMGKAVETQKEIDAIDAKIAKKDFVDSKELGKLQKERAQLEEKYKTQIERAEKSTGDAKELAEKKARFESAKRSYQEAESRMADLKALDKLGVDDPDRERMIKRAEEKLADTKKKLLESGADPNDMNVMVNTPEPDADRVDNDDVAPEGAADDKGETADEGIEDIETNNERMVRITVNLAQYLSVNPPIEGEMLNGEVIQTNLAEFAFIFTLKRAGQDGLKAIQEKLGDDNLQKLKDTMGFVIKDGFDEKTGEPQLVYEFDDNLKDPNVIAKIKEQREGASIKDPKAKALERSGDVMKKMAKESMKSILLSEENLYAKMTGQGISMGSSLFDFFDKALEDKGAAKVKITSLYQNKYVLDTVRESIQGLEGDELNKALDGLGIARDAYQEMAEDDLTDAELKTLLISAGMAKDMPMFQGITVGDVVKDMYRNGDEIMREKLRTEFKEDEAARKLFDAQDEIEGTGLKDIAQEMIKAAKAGDTAFMRDLIVSDLIENKDNLPKDSSLNGSSLVLDLLMIQSVENPDLSLSVEDKIRILKDASVNLIEDSEAQKMLSDTEYTSFIEQYLLSVKDVKLGEVYDLKDDDIYERFSGGETLTNEEYRAFGVKQYKQAYLDRGVTASDLDLSTNFVDALSKEIFESVTEPGRVNIRESIFNGKDYANATVEEKINMILFITGDADPSFNSFYTNVLSSMRELSLADVMK